MRYDKECTQLAELALKQLNLDKNKIKSDFESMRLEDIYLGLIEETIEVKEELFSKWTGYTHIKKDINYQRLMEEIGDSASYLVGLLAKINIINSELNDDGA